MVAINNGAAVRVLCKIARRLPVPAVEFLQTTAMSFTDDEDGTAPLPWPYGRGALSLRVEADRVVVHPGRGVEMQVRYSLGRLSFAKQYRRESRGEWRSWNEGRVLGTGLQWQLEQVYLEALDKVDAEGDRQ